MLRKLLIQTILFFYPLLVIFLAGFLLHVFIQPPPNNDETQPPQRLKGTVKSAYYYRYTERRELTFDRFFTKVEIQQNDTNEKKIITASIYNTEGLKKWAQLSPGQEIDLLKKTFKNKEEFYIFGEEKESFIKHFNRRMDGPTQ